MKDLVSIDLFSNNIANIFSSLENLENLENFYLDDNLIDDWLLSKVLNNSKLQLISVKMKY